MTWGALPTGDDLSGGHTPSEPVATSLGWLPAYTVLFLALAVRGYRQEELQKFG